MTSCGMLIPTEDVEFLGMSSPPLRQMGRVSSASRCTRIVSYSFFTSKFVRNLSVFFEVVPLEGFSFLFFFYSFTQKDHKSSGPFTHAAQPRYIGCSPGELA